MSVSDCLTLLSNRLKSTDEISSEDYSKVVEGIINKEIQLLGVVESIGPFLTNTNHDVRERGCQALASILSLLPKNTLSSTEIQFISNFLCDRLKDHHSVVPAALSGTLAVVQMNNIPDKVAFNFFSTAFLHFHCQSQQQKDRNNFYKIISILIDTKLPELKAMGTDFVYGIISSIDGEKDPRNILFLFTDLVPKFLASFQLNHLTEEMFEVIACYFPVDYQPLNQDASAITRDQLAYALLPCLTAVPEFSEFCIPLALEKLVSDLHVAKLDALTLLIEGCKKFPVAGITPHVTTLWHTLRSELLTCSIGDSAKTIEQRDKCLLALKSIVHKLSSSPLDQHQSSIYSGLLRDIVGSVRGYLSDLSLSLFKPMVMLLECVAGASYSSCNFIMPKVLPLLVSLKPKSASETVTLLQSLSTFLEICFSTQVLPDEIAQIEECYKNISQLYFSALVDSNVDVIQEGVVGIIILLPSLNTDDRVKLYDIIRNLLNHELSLTLRQHLFSCLKIVSTQFPDEVMQQLVINKLQLNESTNSAVYERCLTACIYLAQHELFFAHLTSFLKSTVESNSKEKLATFLLCFRNLIKTEDVILSDGATIVQLLLIGCLQVESDDSGSVYILLEDAFHVIYSIVTKLSESDGFNLVNQFLTLGKLFNLEHDWSNETEVMPTKNLFLLSSILIPLKKELTEEVLSPVLEFSFNLVFHSSRKSTVMHASCFIAVLINKTETNSIITKELEKLKKNLDEKMNSTNVSLDHRLRGVSVIGWLAKALITRYHLDADFWINSLIALLADPNEAVRIEAASMFQTIVQDDPIFSLNSHCNIKFLYKQRLFEYVPKLVACSKNAKCKTAYLMAALYQLCNVPSQVIVMYLSQVLPILIETIKTESLDQLQLRTLQIISNLLAEKTDEIKPHLETFITQFLRLASSSPKMVIRMAALQCLRDCCSFEESIILPYKTLVLQELGSCLDDKKRLVRRKAVMARSLWYFIGSPGGVSKI